MDERGHFRILGVPVRVEWPFFLVAAIFGLTGMSNWPDESFVGRLTWVLIWVAIVFVSVLVHELGHALAYRLNRERSSIVLTAMWGLTTGREPSRKSRRIMVSLAGAVFAFALLGAPFLVLRGQVHDAFLHDPSLNRLKLYVIVYYVGFVNVWWSVANLLPVLPLDGGNIARELVGLRRTRIAGVAVGFVLALWLWIIGYSFAALFLGMLGFMNLAELMQERAGFPGGGHGYGEGRWTDPSDRYGDETPRRSRRAEGKARGGRRKGLFGRRKGADLSLVPPVAEPTLGRANTDSPRLEAEAWESLRRGDVDEATRLLLEATGGSGVSPHLPAALAAAEGRRDDAVTLFQRAFGLVSTPPNLVAATVIDRADIAERLASELLGPLGSGPDAAAVLQNHLHYASAFRSAALVGEQLVADGRRSVAQSAFETSCAWAQAGEPERALEWLGRAVDAGFRSRSLVENEDDLAAVRSLDGYAEVQARLDGAPS